MELFAVEVGAREYCSKSVLYCMSMLFFQVLHGMLFFVSGLQENKEWTPTTKVKVKSSLKETWNSASPVPYLKKNIGSVSKVNSICLVCFINKGNTYYAN